LLVSEITITWSIAFISAKWHKKRIKPLRPDSYLSTGFDKEPKIIAHQTKNPGVNDVGNKFSNIDD
ncbi:MAG: hypothetical protein LKJ55_03125, partial [[Lactobacillus] timonensis]|uniref:hypothetical protein n=1 Tax=[Lactobacillus] timonensis TaxID=1970790 RepID=UPI0023542D3F